MAGVDILSDSTGKSIVAAIKSTDVAQARISEINQAAELKKNEVLESIPEDYRNTVDEVNQLKGDLTNSKKAIVELDDKKITKFYASNNGNTNLPDSDSGKPTDMKIFGKSVQDGTPTPDAPVEIQSVVNPIVKMCGKNLLKPALRTTTVNGITCTNNGDGTYTLNGTATTQVVLSTNIMFVNNLKGNKLLGSPSGSSTSTYCLLITYYNKDGIWLAENYEIGNGYIIVDYPKISVSILIRGGTSCNNLVFKPMVTTDLNATYEDFEPYTETTATLPYTLNAIPVSDGGNVTIDGQQYVADYVDVERGKLVKMVDSPKLDNTQSIVNKTEWLLATPTITDLTDGEVQALKELATHYPVTNVFTTSDQLDGHAIFNYPLNMANGWNYVMQQIGETRPIIYDTQVKTLENLIDTAILTAMMEA